MDFPELQRRVDGVLKIDLKPHYDAYSAQGGGDIDGFLAFLGASQAVDAGVLKELYGMTDVETTQGSGRFQGTTLAALARTRGPVAASPTASLHDAITAVGDGRFKAISRLGTGAMGAVDIAEDVYLRRKVALKTVLPEMATHAEVCSRFLSEMQITAQLEHPNIVPVYALDVRADGSLGYAMKLVQGRDLAAILEDVRDRLEKGQPLPEDLKLDKRLEYFIKVCDAVEYAHSKGVLHRDLKPANVMIGRHNEVYLMDWGIARSIGAPEEPVQATAAEARTPSLVEIGRTQAGQTLGTPQYMSPEQALGKNAELDAKSDQYAMGLILQECVTLKSAVDGRTLQEVLTKAMLAKRDPVAVGARPGALPLEIDAIVRRATRQNPNERYPSVRALGDEVRRYLRAEPVEALAEGPVRRAGRWLAKHRMATLTMLLGIGFVGAAATTGALVAGQARIESEHARELRVSQMVAESAIQTQLVDRDLTRYEAALTELVGAVEVVLRTLPQTESRPYFEDAFASHETAPPDFGPSKVYGRDVSVIAPLMSLAPGVTREPNEALARSLAVLGPAFRAVLLASSGAEWRAMTPPSQRALIVDVGVPALRATIALRDGLALQFPGNAARPSGDPREAPQLKLVAGKPGVVWGTPTTVDGESILPASAAIYDERGQVRGVATLEVSLSRLLARPTAADLEYVESRSLVGRDGSVVAEDNKDGRARVPIAPEVTAAIAAGKSGSLVAEVNGKRYQYTFHPLSSVDWYYVAAGELGRVLESKAKMVTSDPRDPRDLRRRAVASASVRATASVEPPKVEATLPTASVTASAAPDAGPPPKSAVDAGAPATTVLGPLPKPPTRPDPFDNWKIYERKKKP